MQRRSNETDKEEQDGKSIVFRVTNAPEKDARKLLEALGLADALDPIVFAEKVDARKPDPAPYRAALR